MLSICGVLTVFTISSPRQSSPSLKLDESITLEVDQQKHIFYQLSPKDARLYFSIEDNSVATYDSDTGLITGIAPGVTNLKAIAEYNGNLTTKTCIITVTEKPEPISKYNINFTNLSGATYSNNTLHVYEAITTFSIEIYDEYNRLTPAELRFESSTGIEYSTEFNIVILTVSSSGFLNISDASERFNLTIIVEKVEKV